MPESGADLSGLGREDLVVRRQAAERRRAKIEAEIEGLSRETGATGATEPVRGGDAGATKQAGQPGERPSDGLPCPPRMPFRPDREPEARMAGTKAGEKGGVSVDATAAETDAAPARTLVERLERLYREADEIGEALAARLRVLVAEEAEVMARLRSVDEAIAVRLSGLRDRSDIPRDAAAAAGRVSPESASRSASGPTERPYRFAHLPRKPAVPVDESVLDEEIVCLIDGEKRNMIARYLKSKYGMEPDEYREHFGLPESYPMTAPGYAVRMSRARKIPEEKAEARPMTEAKR